MKNERGEISTIVILGTLLVIVIAAFLTRISSQRQITDTRATEGTCRNNPVPPPSGYVWVANCSSTCSVNSDCPKNTTDGYVNPETSNWCYQFIEKEGRVNRCLQLQKVGSADPTPTQVPEIPTQTPTPTPTPTQTTSTPTPAPSSTLSPTPTPTTKPTTNPTKSSISSITTTISVSISDKTRSNITPTTNKTRISKKSSKKVTVGRTINGRACTGNPSVDYGCIDIYDFYSN